MCGGGFLLSFEPGEMRGSPMPEEQPEQTPVVDLEQETPVAEQATEPVAASGDAPVATDDGAVAERPSVDWSHPDNVRSLLEDPAYKGVRDLLEEARLDGQNTGKQRYESEMRRQAASDEVLADQAARLARELGVTAEDEAVRRYVATFTNPLRERSALDATRWLIASSKDLLSEEGQQGIDLALEAAGDDLTTLQSIGAQLWTAFGERANSGARSAFKEELRAMKPEELRKDPDLLSVFERWREAEEKAEAAAQSRAANRVDPGPSGARGIAPGADRAQEIDTILRTARPSSQQYQEAYREKYGFALGAR